MQWMFRIERHEEYHAISCSVGASVESYVYKAMQRASVSTVVAVYILAVTCVNDDWYAHFFSPWDLALSCNV